MRPTVALSVINVVYVLFLVFSYPTEINMKENTIPTLQITSIIAVSMSNTVVLSVIEATVHKNF